MPKINSSKPRSNTDLCKKCKTNRLSRIKRNSYFRIESEDSLVYANAYKPEVVMNLGDLICNNCYMTCKRFSKKQEINNSVLNVANSNVSNQPILNSGFELANEFLDNMSSNSITQNVDPIIPVTNQEPMEIEQTPLAKKSIIPEYAKKWVKKKVLNSKKTKKEAFCIDIAASYSSHKCCIVCRKKNQNAKLRSIPLNARSEVLIMKNIYIPKNCRTCAKHLNEANVFKKEDLDKITPSKKHVFLTKESINDLIQSLRERAQKRSIFDEFYDIKNLHDDICLSTTGFKKENFCEILNSLATMRDTETRSMSQALAVYLFWLKTGLDQETIAAYFNIKNRIDVSHFCQQVREALCLNFVPKNLGSSVYTREEWLSHNSDSFLELYSLKKDQLCFIADGTYCYCQKSSNYLFQRQSFSMQKNRNLVKPFIICAPDGTIVDVYGPFEATKNDATIMKNIFDIDSNLVSLLKEEDLILADRGFRDSINFLKSKKLNIMIPAFTSKKQKQLSTEEANQSRLVTKSRWVIEAINGFIKTFKALIQVKNKMLPHIKIDLKIAGALINRFFKRLYSDGDNFQQIVLNMKSRIGQENDLKQIIVSKELKKKIDFIEIQKADFLNDFPRLTHESIVANITFGSYQIKQSLSYIAEHLKVNGYFKVLINREILLLSQNNEKIIHAKIQSRHKSIQKYDVYVKFKSQKEENSDPSSINGWFCCCKNGSRTMGCCSHIATVIFYLSNVRFLEKIPKPAHFLSNFFPCSIISSYDSDSEEEYEKQKKTKNSKGKKQKKNLGKKSKIKLTTDDLDKNLKESLTLDVSSSKTQYCLMQDFKDRIPHNGGFFVKKNLLTKIRITNTCTIDYHLLGLWLCSKIRTDFKAKLQSDRTQKKMANIIDLVEEKKWNHAKSVWIEDVMQLKLDDYGCYNTYNSQYEACLKYLVSFQSFNGFTSCNCRLNHYFNGDIISYIKQKNNLFFSIYKSFCNTCSKLVEVEHQFLNDPFFLIIENTMNLNLKLYDIEKIITINGIQFELLFCTVFFPDVQDGHFVAVYILNNDYFLVDNLKPTVIQKDFSNFKISTSFYLRKN